MCIRDREEAVSDKAPGAEAHDRYNAAIARASHNPVLIEFILFLQGKLHDLACLLYTSRCV